jgi:hypothetical protein
VRWMLWRETSAMLYARNVIGYHVIQQKGVQSVLDEVAINMCQALWRHKVPFKSGDEGSKCVR